MDTVIHKIGRRKTSVARIYLKKGKGKFTVNTKDWKDYFPYFCTSIQTKSTL
jgi:small subunit ribosomal protein S9